MFFDCIFIPSYALPHTNLHINFRKNASMFAEFGANANVHRFQDKIASFEFPILANTSFIHMTYVHI